MVVTKVSSADFSRHPNMNWLELAGCAAVTIKHRNYKVRTSCVFFVCLFMFVCSSLYLCLLCQFSPCSDSMNWLELTGCATVTIKHRNCQVKTSCVFFVCLFVCVCLFFFVFVFIVSILSSCSDNMNWSDLQNQLAVPQCDQQKSGTTEVNLPMKT